MTVYNVYMHFRNNIERVRKHSITNTDVCGNTRLVLSLEKIVPPPPLEQGWVARSQSARCTESINSVHTINNCTCMSVHFYNIMPTFVN